MSKPISQNTFFQFIDNYTNYIKSIRLSLNDKDIRKNNIKKKSLLCTNKQFNISQDNTKIKESIENINNNINTENIDDWLFFVREFIEFLDFADLSCLFKNDKTETSLYVECDHKHSSYIMYYYDEKYETEYRLSFLDTEIPVETYNIIEKYVSGQESTYMTLVQLDIMRNYGNKRCNQLKLIGSNNDSLLKNSENLYILNIIKVRLSKIILDVLYDILGNINESYQFNKDITSEVLNGYITI